MSNLTPTEQLGASLGVVLEELRLLESRHLSEKALSDLGTRFALDMALVHTEVSIAAYNKLQEQSK